MQLTVNVTDEDIDEGVGSHCTYCPIALATTRALAEAGFPDLRATWEHVRAFREPDGLVVEAARGFHETVCVLKADACPYEMTEFAFMFDDWSKRRTMDESDPDYLDQDGFPYERPAPFSFHLELPLKNPV